jgi:hypothetical protein
VENQGPHIKPKPRRGATKATSIAVVKIARTTSDRRLAMRRVRSHIWVGFAWANTVQVVAELAQYDYDSACALLVADNWNSRAVLEKL